MINLVVSVIIFVSLVPIGNQIHERYHCWAGKVLGANPEYVGRFAPVFPTRTEFRNRTNLTEREVQVISIPGHISFVILAIIAYIPGFPSSYIETALAGLVVGAALISWTDDMAAREPDTWLEFFDRETSEDTRS